VGLRTTRKLMTESWIEDVQAVEAAIGRFSEDRAVTNDCQVALFDTGRDDHLHVNVTHRYATRTARGWAGPARLPGGFVHNRRFRDGRITEIIGCVREMVYASRT
jgi:hypothetical protein